MRLGFIGLGNLGSGFDGQDTHSLLPVMELMMGRKMQGRDLLYPRVVNDPDTHTVVVV